MNIEPKLEGLKAGLSKLTEKLPVGGGRKGSVSKGAAGGAGSAMPAFLTDAVSDLREQGLLPVVVILLVALPVSAIVFGATGGSYAPPASAGAAVSSETDSGSLVVVADRPGLRDHGDRFRDSSPRDPFAGLQGYESFGIPSPGSGFPEPVGTSPQDPGSGDDGSDGSGGGGGFDIGGGGGIGTGDSSFPGSTGSSGSVGAGTSPSPSVITEVRVETEYIHTHTQARLRFGRVGEGDLREIAHLPRLGGLPLNRPVVFYLGASMKYGAALFSVSPEIVAIKGEGRCLAGNALRCHYLMLRPGGAVSMFDAGRMVAWRLAVSSIDEVETEVDLIDEIVSRRSGGPDKGDHRQADDDPRDRPISNR